MQYNQNAVEKQVHLLQLCDISLYATVYKNRLNTNSWMVKPTFILTLKIKSVAFQEVLKVSLISILAHNIALI